MKKLLTPIWEFAICLWCLHSSAAEAKLLRRSGPVARAVRKAAMIAEAKTPRAVPCAATTPWEVHKFGGASLATAELYKQCSDLLVAESERTRPVTGCAAPTMAVVSAKGGVTDRKVPISFQTI